MNYGSTTVSTDPDENGASSMRLNGNVAVDDDASPPPTRQQKLIKAGLLILLILMIGYVILDYTVSMHGMGRSLTCDGVAVIGQQCVSW